MATLKTCFKCNTEKPLTEFYAHSMMADGHLNKCKACAKRDVAEHRAANIDSIREYDRRRGVLEHRKVQRSRIVAEWAQRFPDRLAAQRLVQSAMKRGDISRQPCWICGAAAVAHHPDYSSPLDVVWLCQAHHKQAHALVPRSA